MCACVVERHEHALTSLCQSCRLAAEGLLPFMPAAYGVHNILRRKKLLLARAHSLPGYKEARTL